MLPDWVPDAAPRLVVAVSEPLVLAAAPDWPLSEPLEDEVCAIAVPRAHKPAISAASNLLMGIPSNCYELILHGLNRSPCRNPPTTPVRNLPMHRSGGDRQRPPDQVTNLPSVSRLAIRSTPLPLFPAPVH